MKQAKKADEKASTRLIKGTTLNFLAVGFNQGSTMLVNIIIARILTLQAFGEYAIVYSTLLTVATLSQLATGYTASKYVAEYRSVDPIRTCRIMGLCVIATLLMSCSGLIVLICIAPWIANTMLKAPHLASYLIIGSGYLFFSVINGYQTGALSGLESYGSLAKAGVLSGIISVMAISIGAWWDNLNGAIIGLSISALIRCMIHNRWLQLECKLKDIRPIYRGSYHKEKAIMFKFALPSAIAGYYSMPMIWLANSFLVRQSGGFGEMALYSAANNIRLLVLFFPNVMNVVGLSILNNEKGKGDVDRYRKIFKDNAIRIFIISLSGMLFMGVFGKYILQLFGKNYMAGQFILWILLVSSLFEGLSIALHQYIQSHAKMWLSFISINVPRETFFVLAAYHLVQSHHGIGLAAAYLGSTFIGLVFHFVLVNLLFKNVDSRIYS